VVLVKLTPPSEPLNSKSAPAKPPVLKVTAVEASISLRVVEIEIVLLAKPPAVKIVSHETW